MPEALRPLVAAGLAKDPADRPVDGTALVAELRAVAGGAYGPGWEDRGRSGLAAAALLLAALWPSGTSAAVQSTAVHRIWLRRLIRPRHVSPVKGAIAAGVAVAVAAAVVVAAHARSAAPVTVGFTVAGGLGGMAATSDGSAWAVGCTGCDSSTSGFGRTLILHWNGTAWTRAPSPNLGTNSYLSSVAAAPAGSAWAVGCTGCFDSNNRNFGRTLILRWNGTSWTRVPSPNPGTDNWLYSVAVTPDGTAWAVGWTGNGTDVTSTLILRWNGTSWTRIPSPSPGYDTALDGVTVTPAGTAWAVGYTNSTGFSGALILRWNGTSWTRIPSPSPGNSTLEGVTATPAGTWAVGSTENSSGTRTTTLILRWNGTAWTQVPSPSPGMYNSLSGVAAASDGSAWATGRTSSGTGASSRTLILRWNGTAWTQVPSPDPGPDAFLGGVTALSGTDVWTVGGADGKTLILRWNGQTWSGAARQVSPATAPTSSGVASPVSSAVASSAPVGVSSPVSSAVASPASSAVSSPALPTRRQAGQDLAALLAQSGTDRAAITQAVSAVQDCSPGLSQDETVFSSAASSRQDLLGKLAALTDRSALPASMLQDLTMAWQASGEADQDFAAWTQDEISRGCSTNDQSDPSYQAAKAPDDQATKYKKAFVALWTPIADEYGLPVYQYNQI